MLYWCIKNGIAMVCFTVLAIVFEAWWIVLFAILFMSDYKETPVKGKGSENKTSIHNRIKKLDTCNVCPTPKQPELKDGDSSEFYQESEWY